MSLRPTLLVQWLKPCILTKKSLKRMGKLMALKRPSSPINAKLQMPWNQRSHHRVNGSILSKAADLHDESDDLSGVNPVQKISLVF
ncbi:hypothetical protein KL905_005383 [Ogataea polymorpha]|nr:hypothetical protein KL937_005393 [Ogataea polymorpha]KAG7896607.1 hypothetical protein KL908_000009 [Ogataea polymorpha]KAG7903589.1 hypothetical protein KL935_001121 [Ogataea polymorpha]KAG7911805.1 hypothetical protein KL906_000009 [Ogataea polymorpha]KAG7913622.1 hypothetical protein KL907_000567 [Ogataea polymorpha]